MNENELNKIISANINKFLIQQSKTQSDLAEYMEVSQATASNWCKGIKVPRMNKIDKICSFFNCSRSDLMDVKSLNSSLIKPTYELTKSEYSHIKKYRKLDTQGKNAVDYIMDNELIRMNKEIEIASLKEQLEEKSKIIPIKDKSYLEVNAAHHRTDIDVTDEMKKHDDDIMDDENF